MANPTKKQLEIIEKIEFFVSAGMEASISKHHASDMAEEKDIFKVVAHSSLSFGMVTALSTVKKLCDKLKQNVDVELKAEEMIECVNETRDNLLGRNREDNDFRLPPLED